MTSLHSAVAVAMAGLVGGCGATAPTPAPPADAAPSPAAWVVPTRFEAGRFFATPETADGARLDLLLDTGGNNVLFTEVARRLGLSTVAVDEGTPSARHEAALPAFRAGAGIPLPGARDGRVIVRDRWAWMPDGDGVLGPEWFGWRVWLFDYPGRSLTLLDAAAPPPDAHSVELGLVDDLQFPRVQVVVDGVPLDLLFDTGAHARLVPEAVAAIGDGGPAVRATCFIVAATFDGWRAAHPDWRVVEGAEEVTGQALIEVPSVTFAGHDLGPVWFTRRPDQAFHDFMSQWTDRRIDGALGGNALRDLKLWLDYPAKRIWVAR